MTYPDLQLLVASFIYIHLIISDDMLSCLISDATRSVLVEQRFMFVEAAVFSLIVKSELSEAVFSDTGDWTMQLWWLLHTSLRFVRRTRVYQIVLGLAHFCTHRHQFEVCPTYKSPPDRTRLGALLHSPPPVTLQLQNNAFWKMLSVTLTFEPVTLKMSSVSWYLVDE